MYIAWKHPYIGFRLTLCIDLYMHHFFKKSQTWRQAASHQFLGMDNLRMTDLMWSAQVEWQQGRANGAIPSHGNHHHNSDAQTSAPGASGFLLFSFQLLSSFLTLEESQCCSHQKENKWIHLNWNIKSFPWHCCLCCPLWLNYLPVSWQSLGNCLKPGLRNTRCEEGVTQTPISYRSI